MLSYCNYSLFWWPVEQQEVKQEYTSIQCTVLLQQGYTTIPSGETTFTTAHHWWSVHLIQLSYYHVTHSLHHEGWHSCFTLNPQFLQFPSLLLQSISLFTNSLRKEHHHLTTIYTKHGAEFIYKWQPRESQKLQSCSPSVSISYEGRKIT
jgi:hypothetical protein